MPDVVIHFKKKDWLVLIEAVTSHGPIDPKRQADLKTCLRRARIDSCSLLHSSHGGIWQSFSADFLGDRGLGCGVAGSPNPF